MQQGRVEGAATLVGEARRGVAYRAEDGGVLEDDGLEGRPAPRAYDVKEEGEMAGQSLSLFDVVAASVESHGRAEALARHNVDGSFCYSGVDEELML